MTLIIRLFFVGMLGVALFLGYVGLVEPALRQQAESRPPSVASDVDPKVAQLFGQYAGKTDEGRYVLTLDKLGAELRYTDRRKKEFSYRGNYTLDGNVIEVMWKEQRQGEAWARMQPAIAKMKVKANAIQTPEVTLIKQTK